MKSKNNQILHHSKPSIYYYLLAIFFPIFFFIIDDTHKIISEPWDNSLRVYSTNLFALFLFFGAPLLMIVLRREVFIHSDKVIIKKPILKSSKTYYFSDLEKWIITDIYIPKAGRQVNLDLKFKNKKLTFHRMELTGFYKIEKILQQKYSDKNLRFTIKDLFT